MLLLELFKYRRGILVGKWGGGGGGGGQCDDSTAHVLSNNVADDDDSDGDSRLVICEPSSSSQEAGIGTRDSELEKDSLHYSPVTGSPINMVDLSFEANAQTEVHVHAPGSQSSCEDSDLEEADVIPPVVRVGNSSVGHGAAGNGSVGADTNTAGSMGELAMPGTVPEEPEAQDGGSGPGRRLSGEAVSTLPREGRRESVVTRKRRFRPLLELKSSDEEDVKGCKAMETVHQIRLPSASTFTKTCWISGTR